MSIDGHAIANYIPFCYPGIRLLLARCSGCLSIRQGNTITGEKASKKVEGEKMKQQFKKEILCLMPLLAAEVITVIAILVVMT